MTAMPRYSVCIATYNGEKYMRQQLLSILSQLGDDEVIISDDSSTDNTLEVIRKMDDPRIRIYSKNKFRSPIYNFEFCISQAKGEIIFISDQDDLWLPHKLTTIEKVFQDNPKVTLVASDARIVNENNNIIMDTFYSGKISFKNSVLCNIVKNRFLGCTLAFRRTMLEVLLPFPLHLPMHDSWIGIMNQLFGSVYFINTPLISYRRHSQNFSSSTHSNIVRMITWRWHLTTAVIGRMVKHHVRTRNFTL
jgi:glycosyltransferase involved in cell wall biosynthesis